MLGDMDTDFTCLAPFDELPLTPGHAIFGAGSGLFEERGAEVANAFMAAPAGHPFMAQMISAVWHGDARRTPVQLGNELLTAAVHSWRHGFITVLSAPKVFQQGWARDRSRHPCGRGEADHLSKCAHLPAMQCAVVTTFWTANWVQQYEEEGSPGRPPSRACVPCGNLSRAEFVRLRLQKEKVQRKQQAHDQRHPIR